MKNADSKELNKKLFWERKHWRKGSTNKKSKPILGALSIIGKEKQGRKIILPTGFFEETRIRYKDVRVSNEITRDYLNNVNEKLAPYTITK